ncbi:glycosyltransferase [Calditrichota bacterium LG25]
MDRRCLLITYYFPPTGGGGVQRLTKLIKYASREGWQFTVVTADEASDLIVRDESLLKEIPPSTRVVRVPFEALQAQKVGARSTYFKRWLSAFLFLPDSRKKWAQRAWQTIQRLLQKETFDLVLVSIPPYSLSFLIPKIESVFHIPTVLDLRDPWTLNPYKIHPTPVHRWLDWKMEKKIIGRVRTGISAYGRVLQHYAANIAGFNQNNWAIIPNGYDEADFNGLKTSTVVKDDWFRIGFSGTIYSHLNHPTPLFRALAALKARKPESGEKIRFVHVGKSHIDLKKLASRFGLETQVETTGYLPHRQALEKLNQMDCLCFILDDSDARSRFTIGGKVYEYLRLKKPILALVPEEGEAADLVNRTNSGVVISPKKKEQIADVLLNWLNSRQFEFVFQNIEPFRRDYQARQFVQLFERAVKNTTAVK